MLVITVIVAAVSGALAVWALLCALADRVVNVRQLLLVAGIEFGLVLQLGVAGLGLARGHELGDVFMLWGYLVVAIMLLPGAVAWAVVERTRWSSVALAVGAIAIVVMQARVWHVWAA